MENGENIHSFIFPLVDVEEKSVKEMYLAPLGALYAIMHWLLIQILDIFTRPSHKTAKAAANCYYVNNATHDNS